LIHLSHSSCSVPAVLFRRPCSGCPVSRTEFQGRNLPEFRGIPPNSTHRLLAESADDTFYSEYFRLPSKDSSNFFCGHPSSDKASLSNYILLLSICSDAVLSLCQCLYGGIICENHQPRAILLCADLAVLGKRCLSLSLGPQRIRQHKEEDDELHVHHG
jgi:hypothetical protein